MLLAGGAAGSFSRVGVKHAFSDTDSILRVLRGEDDLAVGRVTPGDGVDGIDIRQRDLLDGVGSPIGSGGTIDVVEGAGKSMPQDFLDYVLNQQGLSKAPAGLKQGWTENGYKYEVRVHAGEGQYTNAQSIYRVSRQQVPTPGVQGTGTSYLGKDGNWYHTSVLRPINVDGSINTLYDANAAQITHIPLP
jgi:hypothetical protein